MILIRESALNGGLASAYKDVQQLSGRRTQERKVRTRGGAIGISHRQKERSGDYRPETSRLAKNIALFCKG
jgi:hypothetical protein